MDRVKADLPPRDPAASRTVVPPVAAFAAEIHVAPDGSDKNAGSRASPVAGLARARDLVRALRARGERGAVAVNVQPGEYPVAQTLELSSRDSGTERGPVVYRAVQPGKAVFYGGRRLTGFVPVADPAILAHLPEEARGKVQRCDLRAQGITDYGRLAVRGFSQPPAPPTLELFVNNRPMTPARWPNTGFVGIRSLLEPGSKDAHKPSVFEYADDRHARWTQAGDAWLFGYFRWLWADATIAVSRIDTRTRTVICNDAYHYGEPGMSTREGIQYYAFNLLEEIDQPGEWYLDREAGVLYLYPPADLKGARVDLGMLSTPMVTMTNVTDVRLEGLTFDLGRYRGLVLTQCSRVLIAGCTVSRLADNGITIHGGAANGILSCDVHTIGRRATEVIGGERETLTPGRHFVENCRIHDFGRIDRTYTPAVQLEGVGNRVAHNLMYDCPSSVMRVEGNDHVIEYNEIRNAVRESDDQGAMDMCGNPTYRGVVFRYNRFADIGRVGGGAIANGQAAIRLDDAISGMLLYGNVFIRSAGGCFGGVQMNCGRDNIIDNNLFIDCTRGITGGWNPGNHFWKLIASKTQPAGFFTTELYLRRYPAIAAMMSQPGINHVWRNVFYRCQSSGTRAANLDLAANADCGDRDPGFVDAAKGDWRLKPDAAPYTDIGFRPIPMDEIGLYLDAYRTSVPTESAGPKELRAQSRWWVSRRIKEAPKLETADPFAMSESDDLGGTTAELLLDNISSDAGDVFEADKPPKGWEQVIYGADIPFCSRGPLPSLGSIDLAATRVTAPGDRDAVINVQHRSASMGGGKPPGIIVRVWFNDRIVYESRSDATAEGGGKPVRIRKGGNTLLVECQSAAAVPADPGTVVVQFNDAKDGKGVDGLVVDIGQR